jgi:uncharacterized protein
VAIDLTPLLPEGRQIIQAYGDGGFRVAGVRLTGSILVVEADLRPEILLLGCGGEMAFVPEQIRTPLRAAGIVIEAMDTGAACRTWNVLLAEERRVAAALIAVA